MDIQSLVAMLPVASVPRSVAFYARLGFDCENDFTPPGETEPVWAWLDGGGGLLMLNRACEPLPPTAQRAVHFVYVRNVVEKHAALRAAGIEVGPLTPRFYAPLGEFQVVDPDGYALMFLQM